MDMLPWRYVHCFGVFCSCLGGAHLASLSAYFVSLSAYDVRLFVHFAGLLCLPVSACSRENGKRIGRFLNRISFRNIDMKNEPEMHCNKMKCRNTCMAR